jgi:hypothetical protein
MGFTAAAEVGADFIGPLLLEGGVDVAAADAAAAAAAGEIGAGAVGAAEAGGLAGAGADLGTIAGSASATSPAIAQTPEMLASQLGYSDPIAAIAGGVNPADLGMVQSGAGGLADLAGYAKTGAQLIGGVGQLAGGIAGLQRSGQLQGRADPMGAYRPQYAAQLSELLSSPQTITSTPGYQFNLAQGLQAQSAKQAAQGSLVGGGALLQAQQFGQQYATSQLGQQQQLLAQLAGAGQSPAYGTQTAANVGGMGAQSVFAGAANVLDPLATLYTKYNQPSPSVT